MLGNIAEQVMEFKNVLPYLGLKIEIFYMLLATQFWYRFKSMQKSSRVIKYWLQYRVQ